jgi:hypothetical protein
VTSHEVKAAPANAPRGSASGGCGGYVAPMRNETTVTVFAPCEKVWDVRTDVECRPAVHEVASAGHDVSQRRSEGTA